MVNSDCYQTDRLRWASAVPATVNPTESVSAHITAAGARRDVPLFRLIAQALRISLSGGEQGS
jgi:hypothetical protein